MRTSNREQPNRCQCQACSTYMSSCAWQAEASSESIQTCELLSLTDFRPGHSWQDVHPRCRRPSPQGLSAKEPAEIFPWAVPGGVPLQATPQALLQASPNVDSSTILFDSIAKQTTGRPGHKIENTTIGCAGPKFHEVSCNRASRSRVGLRLPRQVT